MQGAGQLPEADDAQAAATLHLRVLPAADWQLAAYYWQTLEAQIRQQAVIASWAWTSAYIENYGDIVDHVFVIALRDEEPVGAALVTRGVRRVRQVPVRSIRIGTAGEPHDEVYAEYNRLVAKHADRSAFAAALMRYARQHRGWVEIRLDGFVPEDARLLTAAGHWQTVTEPCPFMDFGGAGDVLALLTKNTRYRIRRSLRSLEPLTLEVKPWGVVYEVISSINAQAVRAGSRLTSC